MNAAPHTAALQTAVLTALKARGEVRNTAMADVMAHLKALRGIEIAYAELVADAAEQTLLAEPAAGRA